MSTPHEFNDILWQLAESQDQKQIEAFLKQHPELKPELKARISMISGIKGAKHTVKAKNERFMPSARPLSSDPPRWAAALAATVLMAGAVFATVGTLKYVESKNAPPRTLGPGEIRKDLTSKNGNAPEPLKNEDPIPDTYIPESTDVPPLVATRANENRVTIVARQISLATALNDIGIQAGIQLNSAPGMPDPTITLDFRDVPAIDVLKALGAKLGFTPMEETDSSILLIPARDPNATSPSSLPGFVNPSEASENGGSGLLPVNPPGIDQNNATRAFNPNDQE